MTLRLSSHCGLPRKRGFSTNASQTVWSIGGKLVFLLLTVGFLAAVTVFQLCLQMGRFLGDPSLPGKGFVAGVLAVAPLLSSLMLALHSGPGLALDAVLAEGPDPRLWLAPRARAFLVMTPALGVFAVAGAFAGGLAAAACLEWMRRGSGFPMNARPLWLCFLSCDFSRMGQFSRRRRRHAVFWPKKTKRWPPHQLQRQLFSYRAQPFLGRLDSCWLQVFGCWGGFRTFMQKTMISCFEWYFGVVLINMSAVNGR
jgi:hypothetical protein